MSPLRKARKQRGWRLQHVVDRLHEINCSLDTGNLSRIERGKQTASPGLAEKLCLVFGGELTELQILYPERFMDQPPEKEVA
ncbi:MAG: helix-turn-helix transcriptional regulator [Pseudomonas sp.]|nr:helix-turn-helix transcriptional regulator [Pseudomonas chengduensis]MDH1865708.1 helix-turn-helix transcriptional regulator [Pseudomonas chengduensis]MDN5514420.1 helix-turn-helix transcriptional regulator [Pseudomonas sp.]